jgi:hypothetical protein
LPEVQRPEVRCLESDVDHRMTAHAQRCAGGPVSLGSGTVVLGVVVLARGEASTTAHAGR